MNRQLGRRALGFAVGALISGLTALAGCENPTPISDNPGAAGAGGATGIIPLSVGTAGSTGAGSGGGTPTVDSNCGVQTQNLDRLPGDVLLVLDTSSSMIDEKIRTTGNSRWADITAALDEVLPATDKEVSWGLMQFPGPGGRCAAGSVDVAVASSSAQSITQHYRANPPPSEVNYTPTRKSVIAAGDWLAASPSPNPKYIVLATDGEPNCRGDSDGTAKDPEATDAIAAVAAKGIPVFVVGIATAGVAIRTLDAMAVAGGRARAAESPKYFPAEDGADFVKAMRTISGQVASCVFAMKSAPPVPDNVLVEFSDGSHAVRDTSKSNGWDYTNAAKTSIELYGPACDKVMSKSTKDVKILFGCPDQRLIP